MIFKNYFSGWVLLIVAAVSFKILVIPLTIATLLFVIWQYQLLGILKYLNRIVKAVAVIIDILGNVLFGYAFNRLLIKGQ